MFHRLVNLPDSYSFFLFGARGTGKTTLLRERFASNESKWFNLLDLETESRLARNPKWFKQEVLALDAQVRYVVVDEIQKLPRLLDVVHDLIETHKVPQVFILTGSSARKLKAGGANLLAGRAILRTLHPLTVEELGADFYLEQAIRWGTLPAIFSIPDPEIKDDFLRAYGATYLKEEVWGEHLVRNLDAFRRFIEVAAQASGKVLNYSNIARDTGVDSKTVQAWFAILEETLVGFTLDAFSTSVRKQLRSAPKFYLFDTGVTRALAHMLNVVPMPKTSYFGDLFEQFIVTQLFALSAYRKLDYKFSYLCTKAGVEIDLVVQRPNRPLAFIEVKSTDEVKETHASGLKGFEYEFPDADFYLVSRDPRRQQIGKIIAIPYQQLFREI